MPLEFPFAIIGDAGSVGIGGITLSGGVGFLVRAHGMTIDQLLAAEIVTAELVAEVFDLRCQIVKDPLSGTPMVVPIGRHTAPVSEPSTDGRAASGSPEQDTVPLKGGIQ